MIPFAKLDIELRFERPTELPRFKGSLLRGALGHALKSIVCAVRVKVCESCLLRPSCLYARTFELKPDHQRQTGQAHFPHPYVLEIETAETCHFSPETPFRFSLLLFGPVMEALPYFIYALERMGEQGLGRKEAGLRATFQIQQILQQGQIIYQPPHLLSSLLPQQVEMRSLSETASVPAVRLHLITPLRVKNEGHFVRELNFVIVVRSLLRRLKSLWLAFGQGDWPWDEKALVRQAEAVQIRNYRVHWHEQRRYSSRQQSFQNLDGLLGTLELIGPLTEFIPLFEVAQVVHLGKETTFSLGQMRYEVLSV